MYANASACIPTSAFHVMLAFACNTITIKFIFCIYVESKLMHRWVSLRVLLWLQKQQALATTLNSITATTREATRALTEWELYVARPGITNSMNILASGWPQPAHPRLWGHQNWERSRAPLWWCVVSICIFNLTCRAYTSRDRCCWWLFITAHHVVCVLISPSARAQSWSPVRAHSHQQVE